MWFKCSLLAKCKEIKSISAKLIERHRHGGKKCALIVFTSEQIGPHEARPIVGIVKDFNRFIHRNVVFIYCLFFVGFLEQNTACCQCVYIHKTHCVKSYLLIEWGFSLVVRVVGWCDSLYYLFVFFFYKCIRTTFAPNFIDVHFYFPTSRPASLLKVKTQRNEERHFSKKRMTFSLKWK